VLLVQIAIQ